MTFGRVKRDWAKVRAATRRTKAKGYPARKVKVTVYVVRRLLGKMGAGFRASACFGPVAGLRTPHKTCGVWKEARTPQSAIAKALKSLSGRAAKRGR